MRSNEKKLKLEVLTDENYSKWSFQMEMELRAKGLWKYVENPIKTEGKGKEKDKERDVPEGDSMAQGRIALNVDPKFYELIRSEETAHEAWNALKGYFLDLVLSTKIQLKARFYTALMYEDETLVQYVDRVQAIWEDLKRIGDKTPESEVVYKVIVTVTSKYNFIAMAAAQVPEDKLTIGFVRSQFRIEDTRCIVQNGGKDISNGKRDPGSAEALNTERRVLTCFRCGKEGHFARDCDEILDRQKKKEKEISNKKKKKDHAL
jgi:hypothetical protein